jgi:predicted flap endonuclease-1-like 5' DNA nuclease
MTTSTLVIIGAAVLLLLLVLVILARTGRKTPELPADALRAIEPEPRSNEPIPEPGLAVPGLATTEMVPEPVLVVPAGPPDPLTRMKGLGPKAEAALNGLGYTRYDQIAAWDDNDVARIDAQMGPFKGRIVRDRWVEQARYLAADDTAGFEAVFGKLG